MGVGKNYTKREESVFIEAALRDLLSTDFALGSIPLSQFGAINRSHYARLLGIDKVTKILKFGYIFAEFEAALGIDNGERTPRWLLDLKRVLADDSAAGRLVLSSFKKISRIHYAEKLGIPETYLTQVAYIFGEFENDLPSNTVSPSEPAWIGALKELLESDYAAGTLPFSQPEKISRKHYAGKLGISAANFARVLYLFKEYEEKIGVEPKPEVTVIVDQLRKALERDFLVDAIPISRSGTIDRTHYITEIGIRPYHLDLCRPVFTEFETRLKTRPDLLQLPWLAELRALLEKDIAAGTVPLTRYGNISRPHYADILGFSRTNFARVSYIFREAEAQIGADRDAGKSFNEARLKRRLQLDLDAGVVELSISGKVNRNHYARIIGISEKSIWRLKHVFEPFDELCAIQTGPMVHLEAMRNWLNARFQDGQLEVRNGKIDRTKVLEQFDLIAGNPFSKYPEFKELIHEFDARVASSGYNSNSERDEIAKLTAALESPPLHDDNVTISRLELMRQTGISVSKLAHNLRLDGLIRQRQSKLVHDLANSKIDPFIFGDRYRFSVLLNVFPEVFLERAAIAFKLKMDGIAPATVPGAYYSLLSFLNEISVATGEFRERLFADIERYNCIKDEDAWEGAITYFRELQKNVAATGRQKRSTASQNLSKLRIALDALYIGGVVPPFRMRALKNARKLTSARPSVLEIDVDVKGKHQAIDEQVDRILAMSKWTSEDGADKPGLRAVLREVVAQNDATGAADDLSVAHAALLTLSKRLDALHQSARSAIKRCEAAIGMGRALLKSATIDPSEFFDIYLDPDVSGADKKIYLRRYFPVLLTGEERNRDVFLANLIKVISDIYGSVLPSPSMRPDKKKTFLRVRLLELGGANAVLQYLGPTSETLGAALTLLMLETGANVEAARTIALNCVEESDRPDFVRITVVKGRIGGPIETELPAKSEAIAAVRLISSECSAYRASARTDSDRLFVGRFGDRTQLVGEAWFREWFREFANRALDLSEAKVSPSMLRSSVILRATLSNDGQLAVGRAIGQHTLAVSQGYQQKWPVRALYDDHMRKYVNNKEAVLLLHNSDLFDKFGINGNNVVQIRSALRKTGFGTFCAERLGPNMSESEQCKTLRCWDDCPFLLFIAEPDHVATLQEWQDALRVLEPEWERDRPERWEAVWLPWLCFADAVEEKMKRGSLLLIWEDAKQIVSLRQAELNHRPPTPW